MANTTTIPRSTRAVSPGRLASKWYAAVRDGDGWNTAYDTAIKVLDAAARANWSRDDVVHLFDGSALYRDAYLTRSDNGRGKSAHTAFGAFQSDWDDAVDLIERTRPIVNKVGAYAAILKIRHGADDHQWTGRAGLRDRIVLNALLGIADALGTVNPQVSTRTLCEDTPYRNHQVIAGALRSLATRGWLTIDRDGLKRTDSTIYRLRQPGVHAGGYVSGQNIASLPVGTSVRSRTPLPERVTPADGPDAVHLAMALTPHQQAVYAALTKAPQSRNQIVKLSGVSRPTVSRALPILALAGLARQKVGPGDEVLGWVLGDTSPEDVVFERGVGAKVDARSARHEKQRKDWADHCEGRSTDRQKAMERADRLRREADAEALRNLAKRPPKPRAKWREDAAPFTAAVRERHEQDAKVHTNRAAAVAPGSGGHRASGDHPQPGSGDHG